MAGGEADRQAHVPEDQVPSTVWVEIPKGRDRAPPIREVSGIYVGGAHCRRSQIEGGSHEGNPREVLAGHAVGDEVRSEVPVLLVKRWHPDLKGAYKCIRRI